MDRSRQPAGAVRRRRADRPPSPDRIGGVTREHRPGPPSRQLDQDQAAGVTAPTTRPAAGRPDRAARRLLRLVREESAAAAAATRARVRVADQSSAHRARGPDEHGRHWAPDLAAGEAPTWRRPSRPRPGRCVPCGSSTSSRAATSATARRQPARRSASRSPHAGRWSPGQSMVVESGDRGRAVGAAAVMPEGHDQRHRVLPADLRRRAARHPRPGAQPGRSRRGAEDPRRLATRARRSCRGGPRRQSRSRYGSTWARTGGPGSTRWTTPRSPMHGRRPRPRADQEPAQPLGNRRRHRGGARCRMVPAGHGGQAGPRRGDARAAASPGPPGAGCRARLLRPPRPRTGQTQPPESQHGAPR